METIVRRVTRIISPSTMGRLYRSDPVTLDPLNRSSHGHLSVDKLTWDSIGDGPPDANTAWSIQATAAIISKKYFEVSINHSVVGQAFGIGVAPRLTNFNSFMNGPGDGCATGNTTATMFNNSVQEGSPFSIPGGDLVIQVAYDAPGAKLYIGVNGTWQVGDPVAGTGGSTPVNIGPPIYPSIDIEGTNANAGVMTINFGATSFSFTVPAGFSGF